MTFRTEFAPVHLRAVSELFVAQLDDQQLAVLMNALDKVTVDCTLAESRGDRSTRCASISGSRNVSVGALNSFTACRLTCG